MKLVAGVVEEELPLVAATGLMGDALGRASVAGGGIRPLGTPD
jgi:hypothetical protein